MKTFKRDTLIATISGPVYGTSTHRGLRVELYRVDVNGRATFHAPSRESCLDWLTRQGYRLWK